MNLVCVNRPVKMFCLSWRAKSVPHKCHGFGPPCELREGEPVNPIYVFMYQFLVTVKAR